MNNENRLDLLRLSTIPLRRLNESHLPTAFASGCLMEHSGKRIVLTVEHATNDGGSWAAEVRYERGNGTKLYKLGALNYLTRVSISTPAEIENIDFAHVEVPQDFIAFYQEIQANGNISLEQERVFVDIDFEFDPNSDHKYGFAGLVMTELADTQLISKPVIYDGLKFKRIEGDYFVFELPSSHPGHEHFQGCSGAPIIDDEGKTVALVCEGVIEENEIYGISLKKMKVALDITYSRE